MPTYHNLKHSANDDVILDKVLQYLAKEEGFSDKPYLDPNGKQWNIGYGSKIDTTKPGWKNMRISKQQGLQRLKDDYIRHRNFAQDALERNGYKNPSGRVLDGLGLLFFNTAWGDIAQSKRFKDAVKTAANGNEDSLIALARSINTVDGKYNALIDSRRKAENEYMRGGSLGGEKTPSKKKLEWNKDALKTQTPTPPSKVEPPIPQGVAESKEGASVWDRLKKYRDEAVDSVTGSMTSLGNWAESVLDKYRGGKAKEEPRPTPSNPIAAMDKQEPEVNAAGLPTTEEEKKLPGNAEEIQRIAAKYMQDVLSDPQVLERIKETSESRDEPFEQSVLRALWVSNNPGKPMPKNITEESLIAQQVAPPKAEDYFLKQEDWRASHPDPLADMRKLVRRKLAGKQQPATSPSPSVTP